MSEITTATPELQPMAIDAKTLAATLGVSVGTVRAMDCSSKIPRPVRIGGRSVRWIVSEIECWLRHRCPNRAAWEALKNDERSRR